MNEQLQCVVELGIIYLLTKEKTMFIHSLKHRTITELRALLEKTSDEFQAEDIATLIKHRTCNHDWRFNGGTCTVRGGRVAEAQVCRKCDKNRQVFADTGRAIVR